MSDRLTFDAEVKPDGRFSPKDSLIVRARLAKWAGKKVTVTVSRYVKRKTLPQLAYFHGVVLPIFADHCGYELDEMKQELKLAYLPARSVVSRLTGEEREDIPSLADLTAEEMGKFLDRVLKEAALQGLHIPSPNEQWEPQEWSA